MEQLIFFAIIIFFSIIESVARSRKQKKGGPLPEVPPEWEWEEQKRSRPAPRGQKRTLPPPDEVPSFDGEPSFDTRATSDDEKAREALEQKRSRSSESMIPTEIWDEIAGLTREPSRQEPGHTPPPRPQLPRAPVPHPKRAPTPPRPAPKVEPRRTPSPTPAKSAPKRATILTPEPTPGRVPAHAVHASHAGSGTDPSADRKSVV